ncbi:MAG: DUF4276 family protein [Planctomycetes bacterium]|nr:DUF4276 family protein [Planctomycetota bacterium]
MSDCIEVLVLAEGRTEKIFVREVLAPAMLAKNIYMDATLVGKTGGDVRFERVQNEIGKHLKQRGDTYVTTMFDYFRIDPNWPGKSDVIQDIGTGAKITAHKKGIKMETATLEAIKTSFPNCQPEKRFIPYIQMHEFEALLFTDASILANKINTSKKDITDITSKFETPEDINDNPSTAPSKILEKLRKGYKHKKTTLGIPISKTIGIPAIREKCVHFNDWLTKIEGLSAIA